MTRQGLIHHFANCQTCQKSCDARNALAWAHNHARTTGHPVELQLGYLITGARAARAALTGKPATP